MLLKTTITLLLVVLLLLSLRLLSLLPSNRSRYTKPRRSGSPVHVLIVLGSGGHTAEMLALLRNLETAKYTRRTYVISSGDDFSAGKAHEFEGKLTAKAHRMRSEAGTYAIAVVPRARKIHQSLLTTPATSVHCLLSCIRLLRERGCPDLIMSNGPATGVILILASLVLRFMGVSRNRSAMRTIYVESWARVRKLSLSGRLLLPVVDRFIVQWEVLAQATGGRAEYLGVLI